MASDQIQVIQSKKELGFCKFIDKGYENAELVLTNIFILLQILANNG